MEDLTQQGVEVGAVILPVEAAVGDFLTQMHQLEQDVAKLPCIPVKICPDEDHFKKSIEKIRDISIDCIPVNICIDEKKFEADIAALNKLAVVHARFDDSMVIAGLDSVSARIDKLSAQRIRLEASLDLTQIEAQLNAIATHRTIIYDAYVQPPDLKTVKGSVNYSAKADGLGDAIAPEIRKGFKDATKDIRGSSGIFGTVGSIAAAPFKIAGGVTSALFTGAIRGIGENLTADFGKGLAQSLSGKLGTSFGSTQFLGERFGDGLAALATAAKQPILSKIEAANQYVNETLKADSIAIGNFTIPLDKIRPQLRGLSRLKRGLDEAVTLGIDDYFVALDEAFPTADRIAEAAAQRAKIQRRRQGARAIAQPQVVVENQKELQGLAQRQSNVNLQIESAAKRRTATIFVAREERRAVAEQIKETVIAEQDPSVRPKILKEAAERIPEKFQKALKKAQDDYSEALDAVSKKELEIAQIDSRAASEGFKVDPKIKSQRLDDLQKAQEAAQKKQAFIKAAQNQIDAEAQKYLTAADTGKGAAVLILKIQDGLKNQIKVIGLPIKAVDEQIKSFQQEIDNIRTRRSEVIGKFKAISTPELQRQGAESAISRTQKQIANVSTKLDTKQGEFTAIQYNPTAENTQRFERLQAEVAKLSKQKQKLERTLGQQQAALDKIPQQANAAIQEAFDAVLGATVPLEKLPKIIVDESRAIESNAHAFYSAFENVIVVNEGTAKQISSGQLLGKELEVLLEEVSHSLQFDFGSAKGLEARATKRGQRTTPLNQVAVPTVQETQELAPKLQNYDPRIRIVELEAKINAKRKASLIEEQRQSQSLATDLESAAGFSGQKLSNAAFQKIQGARNSTDEISKLAQELNVDISETINKNISAINELEKDIFITLEKLAASSYKALPLAEVESLKEQYLKDIQALGAINNLSFEATQELKAKIAQKHAGPVVTETAIAIPPRASLAIERPTVGNALESIADNAIIPAAKEAGKGLVAVGNAGYQVVKGLESLVLDLIPGGRTLKATAQFAAKNVALPAGAAIAASQIPGIGGLETAAVEAAGHLVQSLVGMSSAGIASHVSSIVSLAIPSFIPGSAGIVQSVTGHITELVTGVLDATGTATAEGLATVLSGSTILNVLKKSVETGINQGAKALPAARQAIADIPQVQNVFNAPLPFNPPQREKVLEFAEKAGEVTADLVNAASHALEPVVHKVSDAIHQIQSIDKAEAVQIAAELGKQTRAVVDRTVDTIEGAIAAIELVTAKLPVGQKLVDLGRVELERLKRQLELKLERASNAEAEGKPVLGGSSVIRGDIAQVQRVIEAKAEVVPDRPTISKADYRNNLKKLIQAESKEIEKLRSQLIESLRSGSLSEATAIANELKTRSQAVVGKLEKFKGSDTYDLEPAIKKSVNGYVTRFKDLIAQAENATAKIDGGEDFGALLAIDAKLLAERFTGLVNKLFEVEGKTLQDALGKAALSPRGKDIAVAATGFAGAQMGAHLGILPQVGAELSGAVVARQAVNVADTAIQARAELLGDEAYKSANALEKLAQITTLTVEKLKTFDAQKSLGHSLTGDIAGVSLGNLSSMAGNAVAPGAGTIAGITAALGGAPKIAAMRQAINERLASIQPQPQRQEPELGVLRSALPLQPAYSAKDIEVLQQIERQLAEIERLTQQIEDGQKRINSIEQEVGATEARNRRAMRFDTVGGDRNDRAAALSVQELQQRAAEQVNADRIRAGRATQSDISTVLSDVRPRQDVDRLAQIKKEADAEKTVLADRLAAIKQAGQEERQIEADQNSISNRLASIQKAQVIAPTELVLPQSAQPKITDIRPDVAVDRLAATKAERDAQEQTLTSRLDQIAREREAERNAVNEQLAEIKKVAEVQKAADQDAFISRLEGQKNIGIRERRVIAAEPAPKEDLSKYLARVPGTTSGGGGTKIPGQPTLFIPEIEPPISLGAKAAKGLFAVLEKIPQPIKDAVGLMFGFAGGAFAVAQGLQLVKSELNKNYEAAKTLQSQKIRLTFSLDNAEDANKELARISKTVKDYSTNLGIARESSFELSNQAKGTSLEKSSNKAFDAIQATTGALDLNPEKQKALSDTFTTMFATPKPMAEELKRGLGGLGISYDTVAKSVGLTATEFSILTERGAILSTDLIPALSDQLQNKFGIAALASSDSIQGLENSVANASMQLRENLGKDALPIAAAGLKALNGLLEFATNNSTVLSGIVSGVLLLGLIKVSATLKEFVAYNFGGAIAKIGQGIKAFATSGEIGGGLKSLIGSAGKLYAQFILLQAAIGAFSKISEAINGTQEWQDYSKAVDAANERLKQLNTTRKETGSKNAGDYALEGIGNLLRGDVGGFVDSAQSLSVETDKALGFSETNASDTLSSGFAATSKQLSNKRILMSTQELLGSKELQDLSDRGYKLANEQKEGRVSDPEELRKTKGELEAQLSQLIAVPQSIKDLDPAIQSNIDNFEKLIKTLSGLGPAYLELTLAQTEYEKVLSKQIERDAANKGAVISKQRVEGQINEFDAGQLEKKDQIETAQRTRDAQAKILRTGKKFLVSPEYQRLYNDPSTRAIAEQAYADVLGAEKRVAEAEKQIDDTRTQQRLDGYNRRAELLQREITAQDAFRGKLEALSRVKVSGAQVDIAQKQSTRSISPFQVQLAQADISSKESADKISTANQKLIDQRKDAAKALKALQQVNPNDEQAYQSAKTQYQGLRNTAIATQAEINDARKQGFEADILETNAVEENIKAKIEQTVKYYEQGIAREGQANTELGNAEKRRAEATISGLQRQEKSIDLYVSGLTRAQNLTSKIGEINSAINQGAQIKLGGVDNALKDAEGIIAKLKDKNLAPETAGRLRGIQSDLGLPRTEREAFEERLSVEDKIAETKANALQNEITQSQVSLSIEEQKNESAARRAIIEAQVTKQQAEQAAIAARTERRQAEFGLKKSDIGVRKAEGQLALAQQSGDPLKVREAQLNLQDAQLSKLGAAETLKGAQFSEGESQKSLPLAQAGVVEALLNFANTLKTNKLSETLLGVTNQNKVGQFTEDDRSRRRSLAIEGADKAPGVSVGLRPTTIGFDPFGFKASRQRSEVGLAAERARFQSQLTGQPLTSVVGGTAPIDINKALNGASQEVSNRVSGANALSGFNMLAEPLNMLVNIAQSLTGQLLALAGRDRVKVDNHAYYGREENPLAGTNL